MAWFTEQILSDFLNHNNNHKGATKALMSILEDGVVLKYGTRTYNGSTEVVKFFDEVYHAISSDQGFTAKPVITKDTEGKQRKAVALFSKLELYISWLFRIRGDAETGNIVRIEAERPDEYDIYYDYYKEAEYNDEGESIGDAVSGVNTT